MSQTSRCSARVYSVAAVPGIGLQEYHEMACKSVGVDPPKKRSSDVIKQLWGEPVSPGVRSTPKRDDRYQNWLAQLDTKANGSKRPVFADETPESLPLSKRARFALGESDSAGNHSYPPKTPPMHNQFPTQGPSPPRPGDENTPVVSSTPITDASPNLTSPSSAGSLAVRKASGFPLQPFQLSVQTPATPITPSAMDKRGVHDAMSSCSSLQEDVTEDPFRVQTSITPRLPKPSRECQATQESFTTGVIKRRQRRKNLTLDRATPTLSILFDMARTSSRVSSETKHLRANPLQLPTHVSSPLTLRGSLYFCQTATQLPRSVSRQGHRLNTIEAVLCGIGWTDTLARPIEADKGLIFVDAEDLVFVQRFLNRLDEMEDRLRHRGVERNVKPLYIYAEADLPYFYDCKLCSAGTPVLPLWGSVVVYDR